jgi:hypothetical protein
VLAADRSTRAIAMLILLLPFTLETQISYPQGKQLARP